MKLAALVLASVFAVACGGSEKKKGVKAPRPQPETVEPETEPEPEEPETPPPPRSFHAEVALVPVKGAKMKRAFVSFAQEGEGDVTVSSDRPLDGLKPGKYHLVLHEAGACGKNAAGAGAPLSTVVTFDAHKRSAPNIDDEASLMLDGEDSIVGRTLVLHADKKGRPGKAVACGEIVSGESTE